MTDVVSRAKRSQMMSGIRGRNTKPERDVRRLLHRTGLRFRLNSGAKLPGRPDIALTRYRAAVFVHGCFWHRHAGCRFAYTPKSNRAFWMLKFRQNVERDARAASDLRSAGWRPFVVWECSVSVARMAALARRIKRGLRGS